MKKFFAVLLTILGILGLASCSSAKTSFKAKGKKVSENVFSEKLEEKTSKIFNEFKLEDEDGVEINVYSKTSTSKTSKYDTGVENISKSKSESNLVMKGDSKNEVVSIKGDSSYTYELNSQSGDENTSETGKIDMVYQTRGGGVAFVDKLTKTYSVTSNGIAEIIATKVSSYMMQVVLGFDNLEFEVDEDGDFTYYVRDNEVFTMVYEYESSKENSKATIQLVLDDDEIAFVVEYETDSTKNESWGVKQIEEYAYASVSIELKDVSVKAVDLSKYEKN